MNYFVKKYKFYALIILLILVIAGGYYFLSRSESKQLLQNAEPLISTQDWVYHKFQGENYSISVATPSDWSVSLNSETKNLAEEGVFLWLRPLEFNEYYAPMSISLQLTDDSILESSDGLKNLDYFEFDFPGADEALAISHDEGAFFSYFLKKNGAIYNINLMDVGGKYVKKMMAAIVGTININE